MDFLQLMQKMQDGVCFMEIKSKFYQKLVLELQENTDKVDNLQKDFKNSEKWN